MGDFNFDSAAKMRLRKLFSGQAGGVPRKADSVREKDPPLQGAPTPSPAPQSYLTVNPSAGFSTSDFTVDSNTFEEKVGKVLNTRSLDNPPDVIHGMAVELYKRRGDTLFSLQRFRDASHAYTTAVKKFAKGEVILRTQFLNDEYLKVVGNYSACLCAQLSAGQAARSFLELHEYEEVCPKW